MKTLVIRTTVLFCFVALLVDPSKAISQLNSHTEGLTEEERLAPDPTQVEIPAEVSSNYFISETGFCPPGFDTHTIEGAPPEVERTRPPSQPRPVECTESVETLKARNATRFKEYPLVPAQTKVWSFMPENSETAFQSSSSTSQTPPTSSLPEGFIASVVCPPGFEKVPGGAEKYGIKPAELPGFEPVPIFVCRQLGKNHQ